MKSPNTLFNLFSLSILLSLIYFMSCSPGKGTSEKSLSDSIAKLNDQLAMMSKRTVRRERVDTGFLTYLHNLQTNRKDRGIVEVVASGAQIIQWADSIKRQKAQAENIHLISALDDHHMLQVIAVKQGEIDNPFSPGSSLEAPMKAMSHHKAAMESGSGSEQIQESPIDTSKKWAYPKCPVTVVGTPDPNALPDSETQSPDSIPPK